MPIDGSGNFTRVHNFVSDRNGGIKIMAGRMDAEFDNVAAAINVMFLRSGAVGMTGSLNMNTNTIYGIGDGLASAPAMRFNSDGTTGIFAPGTGRLGFSAGGANRFEVSSTAATAYVPLNFSAAPAIFNVAGTERMRIDGSGNIGIGTTSPTSRVHIGYSNTTFGGGLVVGNTANTGDAWGRIDVANTNTGGSLVLAQDQTGRAYVGNTTNNPLQINTNNLARITIAANGNVGIGTTTPEALLDVQGGVLTRGDVNGYAFFAPKNGTQPFGANYDRFEIRVDTVNQNTILGNTHGGTGAARDLSFIAGNTPRVRIAATTGHMGVGTDGPNTRLHVRDTTTGNIPLFVENMSTAQFAGAGMIALGPSAAGLQGGAGFYYYNKNADGTQGAMALSQFSNTGAFQRTLAEYAYNDQSWTFYTNSVERMFINSSGNVGIGTLSPAQRLDVSGNINTTNVFAASGSGIFFNGSNSFTNGIIGPSNTLQFLTASAERIRVTAAGSVGIGTTSPNALLEVSGGNIRAPRYEMGALANCFSGADLGGGNPGFNFDANDFLDFNRATNTFRIAIGGSDIFASGANGDITSPNRTRAVGTKGIVWNTQSGNYTFALSDMANGVFGTSTAATLTVPAEGTTNFPSGSVITIINDGSQAKTIARAAGVAMIWAATGADANRTLGVGGMCTLVKTPTSNRWYINGTGLS